MEMGLRVRRGEVVLDGGVVRSPVCDSDREGVTGVGKLGTVP